MPDLGTAGHAMRISSWFVEPGDQIEAGDRILEVLTSGITCDIVCETSGQLTKIEKNLDEVVAPGDVLAWIDQTASPPL